MDILKPRIKISVETYEGGICDGWYEGDDQFYLDVQPDTRESALKLVKALCESLNETYKHLLKTKNSETLPN